MWTCKSWKHYNLSIDFCKFIDVVIDELKPLQEKIKDLESEMQKKGIVNICI